jgi:hypothetical protein
VLTYTHSAHSFYLKSITLNQHACLSAPHSDFGYCWCGLHALTFAHSPLPAFHCSQPAAPAHGSLNTCSGKTKGGVSCDFSCAVGYTVTGASNYCVASSGWQLPMQTCRYTGMPCSLPASQLPMNATGVGSCGNVASGSNCTIACASGFFATPSTRLCSDGSLQATAQSCRGNPCAAMTGSTLKKEQIARVA